MYRQRIVKMTPKGVFMTNEAWEMGKTSTTPFCDENTSLVWVLARAADGRKVTVPHAATPARIVLR